MKSSYGCNSEPARRPTRVGCHLSLTAAVALRGATILTAAVVCLLSSGLVCGAAINISARPSIHLCYLYDSDLSDLGWTFCYNAGRLKVTDVLSAEFPDRRFTSRATHNVALMSVAERLAVVEGYLAADCDVILAQTASLVNFAEVALAVANPNVFFVVQNATMVEYTAIPNLIYLSNDPTEGYFVAGAAAAAQATRCVVFVAAWDNQLESTNAFAGFLTGVRSVNTTVVVHVVAKQSWYLPVADEVLPRVFHRWHGCDVFARYTGSMQLDVAVAQLSPASLMSVSEVAAAAASSANSFVALSVGSYQDTLRYVGDSVLTSVYVDWSVGLLAVVRPLLYVGAANRSRVPFFGFRDGATVVARLSPAARSPVTQAAVDAATQFLLRNATVVGPSSAGGAVVCGNATTLRLRNGGSIAGAMDPATRCKIPWRNLGDFLVDDRVVAHPSFVDASHCPAGTSFAYVADPLVSLVCTPCPVNTFSPSTGSAACSPCPTGTASEPGSTHCLPSTTTTTMGPPSSLGVGAIVAVVLAVVAVVSLAAAAYAWHRIVQARLRDAPVSGPLCLVLIDLEGFDALSKVCPEDCSAAAARYEAMVESVAARDSAYVASHFLSSYLLVTRTAYDAVATAVELQESLYFASWPGPIGEMGGLRPRICVHYCHSVSVRFDWCTWTYQYSGPDVEEGVELAEEAVDGLILANGRTVAFVEQDEDFSSTLAFDVSIRLRRRPASTPPSTTSPHADSEDDALYAILSKTVERCVAAQRHGSLHVGADDPVAPTGTQETRSVTFDARRWRTDVDPELLLRGGIASTQRRRQRTARRSQRHKLEPLPGSDPVLEVVCEDETSGSGNSNNSTVSSNSRASMGGAFDSSSAGAATSVRTTSKIPGATTATSPMTAEEGIAVTARALAAVVSAAEARHPVAAAHLLSVLSTAFFGAEHETDSTHSHPITSRRLLGRVARVAHDHAAGARDPLRRAGTQTSSGGHSLTQTDAEDDRPPLPSVGCGDAGIGNPLVLAPAIRSAGDGMTPSNRVHARVQSPAAVPRGQQPRDSSTARRQQLPAGGAEPVSRSASDLAISARNSADALPRRAGASPLANVPPNVHRRAAELQSSPSAAPPLTTASIPADWRGQPSMQEPSMAMTAFAVPEFDFGYDDEDHEEEDEEDETEEEDEEDDAST